MQFQFFPRSQGINNEIDAAIKCFQKVEDQIDSVLFEKQSNEVARVPKIF